MGGAGVCRTRDRVAAPDSLPPCTTGSERATAAAGAGGASGRNRRRGPRRTRSGVHAGQPGLGPRGAERVLPGSPLEHPQTRAACPGRRLAPARPGFDGDATRHAEPRWPVEPVDRSRPHDAATPPVPPGYDRERATVPGRRRPHLRAAAAGHSRARHSRAAGFRGPHRPPGLPWLFPRRPTTCHAPTGPTRPRGSAARPRRLPLPPPPVSPRPDQQPGLTRRPPCPADIAGCQAVSRVGPAAGARCRPGGPDESGGQSPGVAAGPPTHGGRPPGVAAGPSPTRPAGPVTNHPVSPAGPSAGRPGSPAPARPAGGARPVGARRRRPRPAGGGARRRHGVAGYRASRAVGGRACRRYRVAGHRIRLARGRHRAIGHRILGPAGDTG